MCFGNVVGYFVLLHILSTFCYDLKVYKFLTLQNYFDIREGLSLTIPNIETQCYKPLFQYLINSLAMNPD